MPATIPGRYRTGSAIDRSHIRLRAGDGTAQRCRRRDAAKHPNCTTRIIALLVCRSVLP
jgi:hypothetical protein